MLLHDLLDDAVADVSADLPALADTSRRRGLAIRRRHRAIASVGAVAAAAVVGLGVHALVPGAVEDRVVATDTPAPPVETFSGTTVPITAGGVAAALAYAVDEVADGSLARFQGDVAEGDALAALVLEPAGGTGPAGQVLVNLQPAPRSGTTAALCEERALHDCQVRQLPNGDTLRTYRDSDDEMGAGAERLVAEVTSPARRLRVVVGASNTNPWAEGRVRAVPVLTLDQLVAVATQPWWDRFELPAELEAAGAELDLG